MTVVMPDEMLLNAAVEQLWIAMLRREPMPWFSAWEAGAPGVAAALDVSGDWTAQVRFWAPSDVAADLARTLLNNQGVAEPDAEDVEDAVGELANVVAGQLKGALGGESQLGLPVVAEAPAPGLDTVGVHLALAWDDRPVLVSVLPA